MPTRYAVGMHLLSVIFTVLLIAAAVGTAVMDFQGQPQVRELMARLEYRPGFERTLGLIKLTGALGLIIGFWSSPIRVLAALGFVAYFALAVGAHRKLKDPPKEAAAAMVLLVVAALVALTTLAA